MTVSKINTIRLYYSNYYIIKTNILGTALLPVALQNVGLAKL